MLVIDLKEWVLKDLKRIKRSILNGNKSRVLPKRALHINRILKTFAYNEPNSYTCNLPFGSHSMNVTATQEWYNMNLNPKE